MIAILLSSVLVDYLLIRSNFPINFPGLWGKQIQTAQTRDEDTREGKAGVADVRLAGLRHHHQLRALTGPESGRKIQDLPNGVYGFSACSEKLEAKHPDKSALEIHKRHDGITYYVGYASEEDMKKYLARQKKFHIRMFPHPGGNATSVFEIPIYFVSTCEMRPYQNAYYFDLFVIDIPELHS